MPWTQRDVEWVAARLLPDYQAIKVRSQDPDCRINQRLTALYLELMKIRITEQVFFQGAQRQIGDVIDVAGGPFPVGPYRTQVVPGGLSRIAQFVEMPEEIKQVIHEAVASADVGSASAVLSAPVEPPPQSAPTPAVEPIAAPKPAPKGNSLAARVRALTTRRAKFHDLASSMLDTGESAMTTVENDGPGILKRTVDAAQDEVTAIADLADALKAMGNGPLSGS